MAISPEAQAKVALWREKAKNNTLTTDEMKEAIIFLRQDRMQAAQSLRQVRRKKPRLTLIRYLAN